MQETEDQDKVLREMEKGDGRGELWAGHSDSDQKGRGQTFPEMDLQATQCKQTSC